MTNDNTGLIQRLIEGYERAKKPIAYFVMMMAVVIEVVPDEVWPDSLRGIPQTGVLLVLSLILMEILFEIYEKVVKERTRVNIINSNELFAQVSRIISNEKSVHVQYLGLAGRHGWQTVIEKLLNENSKDSIVGKVKFKIEVALLDPEVCEHDKKTFERFDMVKSISNQIERKKIEISQIATNGSSLELYSYSHMPNMMGFLINDNYLFLTNCYWEDQRGEMVLRAGGTDYFVYNKNDSFGGQEFISRFQGWFEYIKRSNSERD